MIVTSAVCLQARTSKFATKPANPYLPTFFDLSYLVNAERIFASYQCCGLPQQSGL